MIYNVELIQYTARKDSKVDIPRSRRPPCANTSSPVGLVIWEGALEVSLHEWPFSEIVPLGDAGQSLTR